MIPCHICGIDASVGWIKGFAPAPDSQKLALCPEHNTANNRLVAVKAWQSMLERDAANLTRIAECKSGTAFLQTATVHFSGGGMLSFICLDCSPTEHATLCIKTPDGGRSYIPMQHIREYSVRPCQNAPSPDLGTGTKALETAPVAFPPSSVHAADDAATRATLLHSRQTTTPELVSPVTPDIDEKDRNE